MPVAPDPRTRPSRRTDRRDASTRPAAVPDPVGTDEVRAALDAAGWHVRDHPGRHGDLLARDASGSECAVGLVHVPEDPAARAALVAHLEALGHDDEHLAAVRAVVEVGDAGLAVLTQHVEGLRLDELAAARGPFSAGEAVTVLVPVAQALAALHRTGRAHGRLGPGAVTLSADGRAVVHPPLEPASGTAEDDVRDLARLVVDLVPPPVSSHPAAAGAPADPEEAHALASLHAELVVALRDDPRGRPAAGTFAARCYDAAGPQPVTMPDPAHLVAVALGGGRRRPQGEAAAPTVPSRRDARGARRGAGGRSRPTTVRGAQGRTAPGGSTGPRATPGPWRAVLTTAGVLVGCAVLVVVGLRVTGDGSPPGGTATVAADADRGARPGDSTAAPGQDPTADRADPLAAAGELTVRRLALLTGGPGDLGSVVVPGSPAEASDTALLAELEGVEVLDARAEVFEVRAAPASSDGPHDAAVDGAGEAQDVAVEVDYAVAAHRQRSNGEDVHVPQGPRTTVVLVLRWTDDRWRVAEVR